MWGEVCSVAASSEQLPSEHRYQVLHTQPLCGQCPLPRTMWATPGTETRLLSRLGCLAHVKFTAGEPSAKIPFANHLLLSLLVLLLAGSPPCIEHDGHPSPSFRIPHKGAPQSRAVRASFPNLMWTECTSVLRDKSNQKTGLDKSGGRSFKLSTFLMSRVCCFSE